MSNTRNFKTLEEINEITNNSSIVVQAKSVGGTFFSASKNASHVDAALTKQQRVDAAVLKYEKAKTGLNAFQLTKKQPGPQPDI